MASVPLLVSVGALVTVVSALIAFEVWPGTRFTSQAPEPVELESTGGDRSEAPVGIPEVVVLRRVAEPRRPGVRGRSRPPRATRNASLGAPAPTDAPAPAATLAPAAPAPFGRVEDARRPLVRTLDEVQP